MARQQANVEYNQFKSGLITEGNLLNLPVDCFVEGENFQLTRDNVWERRKGLGIEVSGSFLDTSAELSDSSTASSVYQWQTHYSTLPEIVVIQLGDELHFFDGLAEPLSEGRILINGSDTVETGGETTDRISATSIEGIFVFTTESGVPQSLQITEVGYGGENLQNFDLQATQGELLLKTRDLWGRTEPSKDRPKNVSTDKQYDLFNQGWDGAKIQQVRAELGVYPSDYDIWWMYKVAAGSDPNKIGSFSADRMKNTDATGIGQDYKNTPAPRGSTINLLRAIASGRPRTLTSYAGRVFYSGFGATPRVIDDVRPDFKNYVFFTQVVKSNSDIIKCYQEADPTSEADSAIADTDGGFIKINQARNIVSFAEVSSGLLILAENGVWMISGTADGLFSATGYSVNKIADYGCVSPNSVVSYGDSVFYWSDEGIIGVVPDQQTGRHFAQNMTQNSIQSLHLDFRKANRRRAVGIAERTDQKLRWLVSTGANPNHFDTEIVYNVQLNSFFQNKIKTNINTPEVVFGYVPERDVTANLAPNTYFVVSDGKFVYSGESQVTVGLVDRNVDEDLSTYKFLVGNPTDGRFAFYQYNNEEYKDFGQNDAEAYLISSPQKLEDTQRRKQIISLATHMKRTDVIFVDAGGVETTFNPSSLNLRIRWDYTDAAGANKWTKYKQCYRYRRPLNLKEGANVYPYEVITARERVRGSGTAFQFEFRTDPEKDCKLLGWAVTVKGGTKV